MKRREALKRITLTSGALVVLPASFVSCEKDDPEPNTPTGGNDNKDFTIDLSEPENSALNTAGGYLIAGSYIVINTGNDSFTALSKACTHNGCDVSFSESENNLPCPCHGSVFALNGSVLNGPATSPLTVYSVSKEGDILTIK